VASGVLTAIDPQGLFRRSVGVASAPALRKKRMRVLPTSIGLSRRATITWDSITAKCDEPCHAAADSRPR
jgi:hypothetical protein